MTIVGTLTDFVKTRKKDILVGLFLWLVLVGIKFFDSEGLAESRYRILIEISIIVGPPLAILWEWREYKKIKKKQLMEEEHDDG